MMIYSHNPLAEWSSVYEAYYASVVAACDGKPTVVVQHEELMRAPYEAVRKLHRELTAAGVQGLTLPAESRVAAHRAVGEEVPLYRLREGAAAAAATPPARARPPTGAVCAPDARAPLLAPSPSPLRPGRAPRPAASPAPSTPPPLRR